MTTTRVSSAEALLRAAASTDRKIVIDGYIEGMAPLRLAPGVRLRGGTLRFNGPGLQLSRDNTLLDITILAPDDQIAIANDLEMPDLGSLTLRDVRTQGRVLLLADGSVRAGHLQIEGLHVEGADVRAHPAEGGFTISNRQPDPAARVTAEILDVSAGGPDRPILGSGIIIGGQGGVVVVSHLRPGEVHARGESTGKGAVGVGVMAGAELDRVTTGSPVTTYGPADTALRNAGAVDMWTATGRLTSVGGVKFVNSGHIHRLCVSTAQPLTLRTRGSISKITLVEA